MNPYPWLLNSFFCNSSLCAAFTDSQAYNFSSDVRSSVVHIESIAFLLCYHGPPHMVALCSTVLSTGLRFLRIK